MTRVPDPFTNCAVFIYPTREGALKGHHEGGCGFLTFINGSTVHDFHVYVVTNSHVVGGNAAYIRLNKVGAGIDAIPTEASLWTYSDDADVAIYRLPVEIGDYDNTAFSAEDFITPDRIATKGIGLGEDTFTIGRFVRHDGRQLRNMSTARMGTIAMMAHTEHGVYNKHFQRDLEAFLVECHTVSGYSGSPVFVRIDPSTKRPKEDRNPHPTDWRGPWLLGIDTLAINDEREVLRVTKDRKGKTALEETDLLVVQATGMSAVTPAWHITKLLYSESAIQERMEVEKKRKEAEKHLDEAVLNDLKVADGADARFDDTLRAMLSTAPSPRVQRPKRTPAKKAKKT